MSDKDPRVERSQRIVRQAALEELAEVGWGGFAIESVAARAGVARSTIYRHWPGKLALVVDAVEHHSTQPPPEETGTGRARVVALVEHLAAAMADPRTSALVPTFIDAAARHPAMREINIAFATRRRRALVEALAEADAADPELAALALAGAIVYARVMTEEPIDPARAEELVSVVLGSRGAADGRSTT